MLDGCDFHLRFRHCCRSQSPPQRCFQSGECCGTSLFHAAQYLEENRRQIQKICSILKMEVFSFILLPPCQRHTYWISSGYPYHIITAINVPRGKFVASFLKTWRQSKAATTVISLMCITNSSTVCGCVHCTMSDSHSRKFPACAHTHIARLLYEDFTLQTHTVWNLHKGSPYLVVAVFVSCMAPHSDFAPTHKTKHLIPCDFPFRVQKDHNDPAHVTWFTAISQMLVWQRDKLVEITHLSLII